MAEAPSSSTSLTAQERRNINAAIEYIRKGISYDQRRQYALALSHYMHGLDLLLPLFRSPRIGNGRFREILRQKCDQYLERARQIRQFIRRSNRDVNGDVDQAGHDDVDDDEGSDVIQAHHRDSRQDEQCRTHDGGEESVGASSSSQSSSSNAAASTSSSPSTQLSNGQDSASTSQDRVSVSTASDTSPLHDLIETLVNAAVFITSGGVTSTLDARLDEVFAEPAWMKDLENVGLAELELTLKEMLLLPALFPHLFTGSRRFRSRLLLYGHEGDVVLSLLQRLTTKNVLRATVNSTPITILTVSARRLVAIVMDIERSLRSNGEELRGERMKKGEVNVAQLVLSTLSSRAEHASACALCFTDLEIFQTATTEAEENEMDRRLLRQVTVEFFCFLESFRMEKLISIVGITASPWLIHRHLRRFFDRRVFCPTLTQDQRVALLTSCLKEMPHELSTRDITRVATMTSSFTRRDLAQVMEEAQARAVIRLVESKFFKIVVNVNEAHETNPVEDSTAHQGSKEDNTEQDSVTYEACDVTDPDAIAMTLAEAERWSTVADPVVRQSDLLAVLGHLQGSVDAADRDRMQSWHEDFGSY